MSQAEIHDPGKSLDVHDGNCARQLIGVIRHAERRDATWSATDSWHSSADFVKFPSDPPLSDHGFEMAEAIGRMVREWVDEFNDQMHNIICSPYLRCVQTAVAICKELGPSTRLIIDNRLAEVQSHDLMGDREPATTTRPFDDIQAYCQSQGIHCRSAAIGSLPAWPECMRKARMRFAYQFLKYLHWGQQKKQNWLFVSHSECVRSTLSMMPLWGVSGNIVSNIEFGGLFLARRGTQEECDLRAQEKTQDSSEEDHEDSFEDIPSTKSSFSRLTSCECDSPFSVLSDLEIASGDVADEERELNISPYSSKREKEDVTDEEEPAHAPHGRRWNIQMHNIKSKRTSRETMERKMQSLAESGPYNRQQLEHLLGEVRLQDRLEPCLGEFFDKQLEQCLGCVENSSFSKAYIANHDDPEATTPRCSLKLPLAHDLDALELSPARDQLQSPLRDATQDPDDGPVIVKREVLLEKMANAKLLRRRSKSIISEGEPDLSLARQCSD